MKLLQGRWRIEILCAMRLAPIRFNELKRQIQFVSEKALTDCLEALRSDGLVVQRARDPRSLEIEYDFSEFMKESLPALLDHLDYWDEFYLVVRSACDEQYQPRESDRPPRP